MNVREQQRNVRTGFQEGNCFIRVANVKRHEAGFLDGFDDKHPEERVVLYDEKTGRDLGGDPANALMMQNALNRRFRLRLIGPHRRHSKAVQLQFQVGRAAGELLQIRSQTQAFELTL